ncbi:MAG TPA: hypothetical protein VK666_24280 [Chryseolinea sp.]|nr:hypothetical protein [Chryseolinea sp.]
MKFTTLVFASLIFVAALPSCKKDSDTPPAEQIDPAITARAEEMKAFIIDKKFQIRDFYSDKPIDYNEEDADTAKKTQLFEFTSPWIKDDKNTFDPTNGKVNIEQGPNKIAGNSDDVIVKDYSIVAEKDDVYFNFLDDDYLPLKYHLVSFTDSTFLIYTDYLEGSKVYTKFGIINE